MLSPRIIHAIYLLHEAEKFKTIPTESQSKLSLEESERNELLQRLTQKGYFDDKGSPKRSLDQISLLDILLDLDESLSLTHSAHPNTPQTKSLQTLERTSTLWLKSIKLNQI